MRIDELMSRSVVTVPPNAPLKQVAAVLAENGISGVPVVEDGTVVGVVSESDIVFKEHAPDPKEEGALARLRRKKSDLRSATTASDAMHVPPVTVGPWMSAAGAARVMVEHDVNRLPVVERGELVGIVSRADLVRAFARPDDEILREIREEVLPSLSLAPYDVDLSIEGGRVALGGELRRPMDVEELPRAVERVAGVVSVTSDLRVESTGTKTT